MPVATGSAVASSYRDRTSELHSIADRLRKSQAFSGSATNSHLSATNGSVDGSARLPGPQASGSVQSEFNKKASRIGLSIHQTSQKLTKLTKLAKRTSMFDDPATEIQELTAVIRTDIKALNDAIKDLQDLCNSRQDGASRTKHSSEHSTTVVDNLKSRLMNTTKEFKDVLELRTTNLKVHENRRQLFAPTPPKDQNNPFARSRPLATVNGTSSSGNSGAGPGPGTTAGPLTHPWANGGAASQTPLFSRRRANPESTSTPGSSQGQIQQQQQQQLLAPAQDTYMQSRAEALRNVESTINELSTIFTHLATMVAQQGAVAIRIDEELDQTHQNVEGAQNALLKYLNQISSNRWLIIKIFMVLVIFLLIFVVFVA
ncbi:hypothetical protein R1flu_021173 [Riccia fluitans]|uniref:t-SNARE coiled-coil homology domain-containing protein n=1 Tax=Riccia fluitans TaxID=41844 RepID=A0ABD1ZQ46_9MARC